MRIARDSLDLKISDSTIVADELAELDVRTARDSLDLKISDSTINLATSMNLTRRPLSGRLDLIIFGSTICTCRSWRVLTCFELLRSTYLLISPPA